MRRMRGPQNRPENIFKIGKVLNLEGINIFYIYCKHGKLEFRECTPAESNYDLRPRGI